MNIIELAGHQITTALSLLTPTGMLATMGLAILGLACASIGWILSEIGHHTRSNNSDNTATNDIPSLPDLRTNSNTPNTQARSTTLQGDHAGLVNRLDASQVIDLDDTSSLQESTSFLNATIAGTTRTLRSLHKSRNTQKPREYEQYRQLQIDLRSTKYKLETKEAELKEFRNRATKELKSANLKIEELGNSQRAHRSSHAQIAKLTETNKQLASSLRKAEEQINSHNEQLNARSETQVKERQALSNKIQHEQNKLSELEARNNDLELHITEQQEHIKDLQQAKIDADSLKEEQSQRQSQLAAERNASVEKLNQELKQLQIKYSEHLQNSGKLKTQINESYDRTNSLEKELISSKKNISKYEAQIEALKNTEISLNKKLSDSEKSTNETLSSKQNEIEKLSKSLHTNEQAIAEMEQKRQTFREETSREIATLRSKLAESKKHELTNQELSQQVSQLQEKLAATNIQQQRIQDNNAKIAQLTSVNDKNTKELKELKAAQQQKDAKLDELQTQLSSKQKEIESNLVSLNNLKTRIDKSEAKNNELLENTKEIEQFKRAERHNQEKLETLLQDLEQSNNRANESESKNKQAQTLLQVSNQELSKLEQQLKAKDQRVDQLQTKTAAMIAEIESYKSNQIDSKQLLESKDAQVNALQADNENLNSRIDNAVHEKGVLEKKLDDSRAELNLQTREIEKQAKISAELKKSHNQELQAIATKYAEQTTQETTILNDKLATALKQADRYQQELDAQTISYKQLEGQLSKAEQEKKRLEDKHNIESKQNESFRKQIEDARHQERQLKEKIANYKLENDATSLKYSQKSTELESITQTLESVRANQKTLVEKEAVRLTALLEEAELSKTTLSKEKSTLEHQLEKTSKDYDKAKSIHTNNIAKFESELSKLREDLNLSQQNNSELREKRSEIEKNIQAKDVYVSNIETDYKKQIAAIQSKLKDSEIRLNAEVEKNKNSISEKNALEAQLKQQSDSLNTLKATIAERDSAITQARKSKDELDKVTQLHKQLLEESAIASKALDKSGNANQQLEKRIAVLESEKAKSEKLASDIQAQIDEKEQSFDASAKANAKKLDELSKRIDVLTKEKNLSDTKLSELHKTLVERDETIKTKTRENEKYSSLKADVAKRQADIEQLHQKISHLSGLEGKLIEQDKVIQQLRHDLKSANDGLAEKTKKVETLGRALSDASKNITQRITDENSTTDGSDESLNSVELTRLEAQVTSLKTERDLGLERVRELSTELKSIKEKQSELQDLKAGATEAKHTKREVDLLRSRISSQETDLRSKKLTIDQLRRELARMGVQRVSTSSDTTVLEPLTRQNSRQKTAASGTNSSNASGSTAVLETPTKKSKASKTKKIAAKKNTREATESQKTSISSDTQEHDDLKKVNGIGPKIEKQLRELGITSYRQIAEFTPETIEQISNELAFPGRIERDGWVSEAKKLYLAKHQSRDQ